MGHHRPGRRFAVIVAAIILWVQPTRAADFISGNRLVQYCREETARQFVLGFVAGVNDTAPAPPKGPICVPEGVKLDQLADVVCKYLTDHPESRHYTGSSLAISAIRSAFPCPK